jgi:hypothetical protein
LLVRLLKVSGTLVVQGLQFTTMAS